MCAIEYYTYEEYCQWEGDWELIGGVPLAMAPAPMIQHQALDYAISRELMDSIDECREYLVLGKADWKINDDTIVKPDMENIPKKVIFSQHLMILRRLSVRPPSILRRSFDAFETATAKN